MAHGEAGGRPPVLLSLNPSAGLAVGSTSVTPISGSRSRTSRITSSPRRGELDVDHSADEGLDAATALIDSVLEEADVDRERVLGVGMGLPGPIDRSTGTVGSSSILPGWVGVDAAAEMERRIRLPVYVENDANLGALAEFVWGAGTGYSDVVYIKLSSGVGAGLVLGGRLHEGAGGTAGEIGHMPAQTGTEICRCGSRGCLETVASARAIAEQLSASRGESVSTQKLLELTANRDPAASRLIAEAGREIGLRSPASSTWSIRTA